MIQKMTVALIARPLSTSTWLLDSLRSAILAGTLEENTPVRQEELAATYGVSRMPVREALRSLEAEGWVIHRPNKGVVVAPLDPEDAAEIFDIRAVLEALALRRSVPLLDERQRGDAVAALAALETAAPDVVLSAHRAFHLSLCAAAGGRLLRLIGQQLDAAERYLRAEATLLRVMDEDRYEHRALLERTLARDARAVVRLIEKHVAGAGAELAETLRKRGFSKKSHRKGKP
jgi:DNA-binding GntR family transcriptional regulator